MGQTKLHILLGFLLFLGVVIRLSLLYPLYEVQDGDVGRDYIVARHIIKYHELPITGPNNAVYEAVRATPLYYYLLSIPVFIYDSVYAIGVFNIALQALTMVALWLLSLVAFGKITALFTAILLLFNQELFSQSFYMIQAHIGQTVFALSYLLLTYGFVRRSYHHIWNSAVVFAIGCCVSFHGFPALIGFVGITWFALKSTGFTNNQTIGVFGSMMCIMLGLYAPVIARAIGAGNMLFLLQEPVYTTSLYHLPTNMFQNLYTATNDFVLALWFPQTIKTVILTIILLLYLTAITQKTTRATTIARGMGIHIGLVVFWASWLNVETHSYQYDAISGLILILLAYSATSIWQKSFVSKATSILLSISLVFLVIPHEGYVDWKQSLLGQPQKLETRLAPIFGYLDTQKTKHPNTWHTSFTVVMYNGKQNMYHWSESVIWNALEHRYNRQFVRVINEGYNYEPIIQNPKEYLLICQEFQSVEDARARCLSLFQKEFGDATIKETLSWDRDGNEAIFLVSPTHFL